MIHAKRIYRFLILYEFRIFRFFSTGATYDQITAAMGRAKGWISEDLRYVEELTSETIRKGSPTCKHKLKKNSKHALEQLTRTTRSVGMFAASLYGGAPITITSRRDAQHC